MDGYGDWIVANFGGGSLLVGDWEGRNWQGLVLNEFVEEGKELLEGGSFIWGEEADDFFPRLAVVEVKFLFDPVLELTEVLFLGGFGNASLTAGKEVAGEEGAEVSDVGLTEVHSRTLFDVFEEIVEVLHGGMTKREFR